MFNYVFDIKLQNDIFKTEIARSSVNLISLKIKSKGKYLRVFS